MLRIEVIDYIDGTSCVNTIYKDDKLLASFDNSLNQIDFSCLELEPRQDLIIVRYLQEENGQLCINKIEETTFLEVCINKDGIKVLRYE